MFTEEFKTIVDAQNAPITELMGRADGEITKLKKKISNLTNELDRLKTAKCPECGCSLPADGRCIRCMMAAQVPDKTGDAYRLGCEHTALAIACCREKDINPVRFNHLQLIVNELTRLMPDPDKKAVFESIVGVVNTKSGYTGPEVGPDSESFSKLCDLFNIK